MTDMQQEAYTGVDNLEVMEEAVNYNRYLLKTVREHAPPRAKIIDFGAGAGQFAAPLAELGIDITAVEPDEILQQKLRARSVRVVGSVDQLSDDSYDYIYTLNVLEHIENDAGALRSLHAKLTLNGRLLIYVPAHPVLYTSMDAKVGHVRRYTRDELMSRARAAGFHVERIEHVDSIGFFATLLFKLIGNKNGNVSLGALKIYDRLVFPLSRALDLVTRRWFGKNLLLICTKARA